MYNVYAQNFESLGTYCSTYFSFMWKGGDVDALVENSQYKYLSIISPSLVGTYLMI